METINTSLRIPEDIYQAIQTLAKLHRRSMHSEMLCLIEDSIYEQKIKLAKGATL